MNGAERGIGARGSLFMLNQRLLAVALCVVACSALDAAQFGGEQKYKRFTSPELVLEVPDNWTQHVAVTPPVLLLFTRGNDTSFRIDRQAVPFDQTFDQIFTKNESEILQKKFPNASGLTTSTITHPGLGPILQIDFTLPASQGSRAARFRQYSIPVQANIYRVLCVARADQFDKQYARMFTRMIASLAVTPPKL